MSDTTDGNPKSLSDALDDVFAPLTTPTLPPREDLDQADESDLEPADVSAFQLPEIVPATSDTPIPEPDSSQTEEPDVLEPPAQGGSIQPESTEPERAPVTGWGDHMAPVPSVAQGSQLRSPGRRPRVRRVTRVVRHVDPWSTFKVALLFSAVAYVVSLTAGVLLWRVADSTGTLANIERWFTQFGWETFELQGSEIFKNAWVIGLFGAVAMTGGIVLLATLFNLVSDIIGGIRVTVLEEEVVEHTVSSTKRYMVRSPTSVDGLVSTVSSQAWDVDDEISEEEPSEPLPDQQPDAADDWSVDDDESVTDEKH